MTNTSGILAGDITDHARYLSRFSIEGGMGIVIACRDRLTGHKVALKTFKPKYLSLRVVREHFLDEASNWILLGRHPNLVSAHEIIQIGNPPQPCLVLDWIEGRHADTDASLRTIFNRRRRRPLGFARSMDIALGIARGMHHATTAVPGFVHNDLKPENILIDHQWRPYITDMGMSQSIASLAYKAHDSPLFPCTPGFCAPEQLDPDSAVDMRADIHALGCILYEMVTGLRINPGQDEDEKKQFDKKSQLRAIPDALPASIRVPIETCVRRSPGQRYQDWTAVGQALTDGYRELTGRDPEASDTQLIDTETTAHDLARSLLALGKSFRNLGDARRAIDSVDQGLELAQQANDGLLQAGLFYQRGIVNLDKGDLSAADGDLAAALRLFNAHDENMMTAEVLSATGMLHAQRKDFGKALNTLEQALKLARRHGGNDAEISVLGNLGNVHGQAGDPAKAAEYFQRMLAAAESAGDEAQQVHALASLGVASYDMRRYGDAIDLLNRAVDIYRRYGDDPGRLHALEHLWQALAADGQQAEAERRRRESLELARLLDR